MRYKFKIRWRGQVAEKMVTREPADRIVDDGQLRDNKM